MKRSKHILLSTVGLMVACSALPAEARFSWGLGTGLRIPGTGVYTGVGYSRSRWGGGFNSNVYLDAGYYLDRARERKARSKGRRREEAEVRENLSLRVSPSDVWVYLNGVLVDSYGKDDFSLPPGLHRLEFVRAGYRTKVAKLDVQPDGYYKLERKLEKLDRGEPDDPRLERRRNPVSISEALRLTASVWSGSQQSGSRRERLEQDERLERERGSDAPSDAPSR